MKPLSQNKQFENLSQMRKFYETHKIQSQNGVLRFNADVFYYKKDKYYISDLTKVEMPLRTSNNGDITISETEIITVDNTHCSLSHIFQTYYFNENTKKLEITGNSDKMGKYKVIIEFIDQENIL